MAVNVRGDRALEFDMLINDSDFGATIRRIEQQLKGLTQSAENEGRAIEGYAKKAAAAIAAYASFATATNFISDIVRVRGEFQQLEVAFQTMLKSKSASDKLLAEATELAAKTPFTLQDVGAGAKQLLAYGFGANEIIDTLRRLGDVASGVGAPLNDIVYLYGTTRTQGRLYAQDLMQFTSRGIPIIAELAKQFNVTEGEVKGLVEAGKVGFPQVQKVIESLTSQGGLFFNLMEAQSKTLTGQISNLQDAWARMLNEIGKENQGVFSTAIQAAISLVENYETVLDVLKVLVITYGSYRAAIIATNAVTAISTSLAKGYTIAETLRFQAMVISDRAMKILNATMLSNPFVAVTAAVTALVASLVIFGKEARNVKSASDLVADAQKGITDSFNEQEAKIRTYMEVLKAGNVSEQQRLDIYNKLRDINPDLVKGLDAQTLSYEALAKNVNAYLTALRSQLALEANDAAIKASIQQEQAIQSLIKAQEKRLATVEALEKKQKKVGGAPDLGNFVDGRLSFSSEEKERLEDLRKELVEQQKVTESLGQATADLSKKQDDAGKVKKRTIDLIEDEIKELKKRQSAFSANNPEFEVYEKQIKQRQKELALIKGEKTKEDKKDESEAEKRAKKLKDLEESIADAERRARQSGLVKEESELDRINARYDELKKKATELKASAGIFTRIENARTTELGNERIRDEVAEYKKEIDAQRVIFEDFEKAKKEIGVENAKAMFTEQTQGFDSFLSFLQNEADKFLNTRNTLGGQLRLQLLGAQYTQEDSSQQKRAREEEEKRLVDVLKRTTSINAQRKKLEENYQKDLAVLRKRYTGEDLKEREEILKQSHEQEVTDLKNSAIRQSDIYKKLNEDIIGFTRAQLKERIKDLKNTLEKDTSLTPQMKADIQSVVEQLEGLLKKTSKGAEIAKNFEEIGQQLFEISSIFSSMSSATEDLNAGLADTLATMGELVNVAGNVASAVAQFASGNIVGGIASTVQAVMGVFSIGKKARESERKAAAEIAEFNDQILSGEIEITQQYRERERLQAAMNKARLQALQDEKKLLDEQKKAVQDQFNIVLQQLQQQTAVVGKSTEQYGGFFGIGRKTRAVDIVQSLAGKSYDDLEKLFLKGQLEGKAKELFELLQKLKREGADIDTLLAQNAAAAQEAFTGTTADSITDSIIEGFKAGKKGAADFANDFEGMMQQAILQALKFQALEGPLQEFYAQFAADAETDGILTEEEIRLLRERFNSIVNNASAKFDELQQITDIDLAGPGGSGGNSLSGAIKGITQQQADLLAGQFGGLRITALDQLRVANQHLATLQAIQNHTSNLEPMYRLWQRLETNGIKVK